MDFKMIVALFFFLGLFAISAAAARPVALSDGGVEDAGPHTAEVQEPVREAAQTTGTGRSQVTCQNTEAVTGDIVTVTVLVNSLVDWAEERMDVVRDEDVNVYSRRHQQDHLDLQSPQYANRTTFNPGPNGGNLSFSNPTSNDSGSYKVSFRGLRASCIFHLKFVDTLRTTTLPVINTTNSNNDDAGTNELSWEVSVSVGVSLAVLLLLAVAVGVYLWKTGRMKNCVSPFRGRRRPEAERCEEERLNDQPAERREAAHYSKENGQERVDLTSNGNCL